MFEVVNKTIHATRGDVGCINVTVQKVTKTAEGEPIKEPYKFQAGDVIRLNVMKKGKCEDIVLSKDVVVEEETELVHVLLTGADTKIGDVISKEVVYWYEVELNPDTNPQTILGYDRESGAKQFILYPEGGTKND